MSTGNKTKKIIVAATATTVLAFAGVQGVMAGSNDMKDPGSQHPYPLNCKQLDKTTQQNMDTFLSETTELRKNMAEKKAAMQALMKNSNPDSEKAAKLAGEIFDLREQLRIKAKAAGLPAHMMMGKMGGKSMMGGNPKMRSKHHGTMIK